LTPGQQWRKVQGEHDDILALDAVEFNDKPQVMTNAYHPLMKRQRTLGAGAFTLMELLVVVAVIAVLAGLLLPALTAAKAKAQGAYCINNARQLTLAWSMYAADNEDRLVYNLGGDRTKPSLPLNLNSNWVGNVMTWELDRDNTNLAFIKKAKLAPFSASAPQIYRCPADHVLSEVQRKAGWTERVRSVSMNAMVGDAGPAMRGYTNMNNPEYRQFLKLSTLPNPAQIFVFLDEHPDSINDGYFLNRADDFEWVDLPASYHNGAGSFSFADGHTELHRWLFANTRRPAKPDTVPLPFAILPQESADFDWLMQRTSVER
jgi:prepilin-type N-terminal cleavage/methylation domain-containing protein/prepilin-type processing-associated H-X9-DG protein